MCVVSLKKTYILREMLCRHISLQGFMSALYPSSVFSSSLTTMSSDVPWCLSVGWLVGRLVGWLVGWSVGDLFSFHTAPLKAPLSVCLSKKAFNFFIFNFLISRYFQVKWNTYRSSKYRSIKKGYFLNLFHSSVAVLLPPQFLLRLFFKFRRVTAGFANWFTKLPKNCRFWFLQS